MLEALARCHTHTHTSPSYLQAHKLRAVPPSAAVEDLLHLARDGPVPGRSARQAAAEAALAHHIYGGIAARADREPRPPRPIFGSTPTCCRATASSNSSGGTTAAADADALVAGLLGLHLRQTQSVQATTVTTWAVRVPVASLDEGADQAFSESGAEKQRRRQRDRRRQLNTDKEPEWQESERESNIEEERSITSESESEIES
jgi:hypothetical protein